MVEMDEEDDDVDLAELENMDDMGLALNSPVRQTFLAKRNESPEPDPDPSSSDSSSEESDNSGALGTFADIQEVLEQLVKEAKTVRTEMSTIRRENQDLKAELASSIQTQAAIQDAIGIHSIPQLSNKSLWNCVGLALKRKHTMDKKTRSDMKAEMSQLAASTRASVQIELRALETRISTADVAKRVSQLGKAF